MTSFVVMETFSLTGVFSATSPCFQKCTRAMIQSPVRKKEENAMKKSYFEYYYPHSNSWAPLKIFTDTERVKTAFKVAKFPKPDTKKIFDCGNLTLPLKCRLVRTITFNSLGPGDIILQSINKIICILHQYELSKINLDIENYRSSLTLNIAICASFLSSLSKGPFY